MTKSNWLRVTSGVSQLSWRDLDLKERYMKQMCQVSGQKWRGNIRNTEGEFSIESKIHLFWKNERESMRGRVF